MRSAILNAVGVDRTCLVAIDGNENRNAALSARNIDNVDAIRVDQLNAFELLNHRYLVVDQGVAAGVPRWLSMWAKA